MKNAKGDDFIGPPCTLHCRTRQSSSASYAMHTFIPWNTMIGFDGLEHANTVDFAENKAAKQYILYNVACLHPLSPGI